MREFLIYSLIFAAIMSPLVVWVFDDIDSMANDILNKYFK